MGTHTDNIKEFEKKLEGGGFPIPDQGGIYTKGGTEKPKRKVGRGSPSAKRDFAADSRSGANRPRTSKEGDTYEARYAKSGSLTESTVSEFIRLKENKKCKCGAKLTKEGWTECEKCHESAHSKKKDLKESRNPDYPILREAFDAVKSKRLREMSNQFEELEDDDFLPDTKESESDFSYLDEEIPDDEFDDEPWNSPGAIEAGLTEDDFDDFGDDMDATDEDWDEYEKMAAEGEDFGTGPDDGEIDMLDMDSLDAMADDELGEIPDDEMDDESYYEGRDAFGVEGRTLDNFDDFDDDDFGDEIPEDEEF